MKKFFTVLAVFSLTICALFASCGGFAFADTNKQTTRALVPCSVFAATDEAETVCKLPQNEIVEIVETVDAVWTKVVAYGKQGYVRTINLYTTDTDFSGNTKAVRAITTSLSERVSLYKYPSFDSEISTEVKDNTKLAQVVDGIEYGEFVEITYDGTRVFALKDSVTEGLTYSQTIAIILGVVGGILILLLLVLVIYGYRLKLR